MLLLTFALLLTLSWLIAARAARTQVPGPVKYPCSTRLSLNTLQRTHAVPEDRC